MVNNLSSDLRRPALKFERFQDLLQVKDGEKFRSLTSRMSCLMTVTEMSNELELSSLLEIIHDLTIAQKYLIVFMDTFNATMFLERNINFNVMINHREPGRNNVLWYLYHT